MFARWPSAFALSAALHAGIVGIALWLTLQFAKQAPVPPAFLHLIMPSNPAAHDGPPATSSMPSRIWLNVPVHPIPAADPNIASAPDEITAPRTQPAVVRPRADNTSGARARTPSPSHVETGKSSGAPSTPTRTASRAAPTAVVQHINVSDIVDTLRTEANDSTTRGADAALAQSYQAMLEGRLRQALEREPGLDDGLMAEAAFQLLGDGRTAHARLTRSSGNERFDAAVLKAIRTLVLPPPPPGFAGDQRIPFTTHARQS